MNIQSLYPASSPPLLGFPGENFLNAILIFFLKYEILIKTYWSWVQPLGTRRSFLCRRLPSRWPEKLPVGPWSQKRDCHRWRRRWRWRRWWFTWCAPSRLCWTRAASSHRSLQRSWEFLVNFRAMTTLMGRRWQWWWQEPWRGGIAESLDGLSGRPAHIGLVGESHNGQTLRDLDMGTSGGNSRLSLQFMILV